MRVNYSISMKFLLCMMVVALSNASRIPRSFDTHTHHNFPNLQTVHHGHGATSYQNIQIQSHGEIAIPTKPVTTHHYVYAEHNDHELQYEVPSVTGAPYLNDDGIKNHLFVHSQSAADAEPYTSNNIEHIEINNIAEPSAYYDQYDQEYDYGYH